jgi:hypothetical protein
VHGVDGADCRLIRIAGGVAYLAGHYRAKAGESLVSVTRIESADYWSADTPRTDSTDVRVARVSATVASQVGRAPVPAAGARAEVLTETSPAPISAVPVSPYVSQGAVESARVLAEARIADQRQGHSDAATVAATLPLHAYASLAALHFDVVRWLEPWRDGWRLLALGQAPPDTTLAKWLQRLNC